MGVFERLVAAAPRAAAVVLLCLRAIVSPRWNYPGSILRRSEEFHPGNEGRHGAFSCHDAAEAAFHNAECIVMLGWALTFLVIALIAAVLGFGGIAGLSIEIAKIIFFVAVVLFLISALVGIFRGRNPTVP